MPPHHHREKYHDWWYEDLPEGCKKAAAAMGYVDQAHWDEDKPVPFDTAKFSELSLTHKRAAWHLGWDVIDEKLDIWWSETDEETKAAAHAVGWSQETWDDDWRIQDLPIEHKYWDQLTDAERAGATHFGYTKITWDETGETEWKEDEAPAPKLSKPAASASATSKKEEEKKEEQASADGESKDQTQEKKKIKVQFVVSDTFGGSGGGAFDDMNHRKIKKITVFSGALVDAIMMTYENGDAPKHGGSGGGENVFELDDGEYVNAVTVRHSNMVQCLTFHTSKGRDLGPCGGKGRLIDKRGEEVKVQAPSGMGLCGIKGTSGSALDSIAFRWSTVTK